MWEKVKKCWGWILLGLGALLGFFFARPKKLKVSRLPETEFHQTIDNETRAAVQELQGQGKVKDLKHEDVVKALKKRGLVR